LATLRLPLTNSGQTFPLTTRYPFGFSVERPVIVHRFGSLEAKQEQRFLFRHRPRRELMIEKCVVYRYE